MSTVTEKLGRASDYLNALVNLHDSPQDDEIRVAAEQAKDAIEKLIHLLEDESAQVH